jgi:phosphatidylinositol-3-phosphatase
MMRARALAWITLGIAVAMTATACGGGSDSAARKTTTTTSPTTTTSGTSGRAARVCGNPGSAPAHYDSVVVFSFENRTWNDVGLGFGPGMPYLHGLGAQCTWFPQWTETDPTQNSLTQYVGQITGARQPGTENDCSPSATCSTDADSIFRQLRHAGRRAVNYVEGATQPCSAEGNAVRHVPALYLWAPEDRQHCAQQVRPLTQLDVRHLPAFAFVTPTVCNDGHDCDNQVVDGWARQHIQPVLDTPAYRAGKVAVFVWYDEDTPVPNLWITPTAAVGPRSVPGAGAAATLGAWQSMLGLPCLANACGAPDLRAATGS